MPPKAKMPAPIDRPLSRAYLREFSGWSTAYPPGASPPTSLRKMENILISREGAAMIRPGLKRLTTSGLASNTKPISSHEPFYLNNGKKAYLLAVRETVGPTTLVTFRVGIQDAVTGDIEVVDLLHAEVAFSITGWATLPFFSTNTTYVKFLQIDNKIIALSNAGEPFIVFHVGATKKVPELLPLTFPAGPTPQHAPDMFVPQADWVVSSPIGRSKPPQLVGGETATSLQSNNPALNTYNVAAFVTYSNELGESYSSRMQTIKIQYPFGQFSTKQTDAGVGQGIPNALEANATPWGGIDAAHQIIVAHSPVYDAQHNANVANGATKANFYFLHWSAQDSVPVEGLLFKTIDLTPATPASDVWASINFSTLDLGKLRPLPSKDANFNTTGPVGAGQGIVAADRLVLVRDPGAAAVIRWTGNNQGDYLNFDAIDGGGFKTLTSGNMQIPSCVKLWQNPQSADTITVLNEGTDGYSTAYYMQPASVSSQSDNTIVMGFEETTATPGTTSPYGCEVANNALYHPLDDQLMKSTASNYNISHKSITDMIANKWTKLRNKDRIVSCFHDQRIYYLVDNPEGAVLEANCMGNEVWVLDLAAETPLWSRWLVQGVSLRKIEVKGQVYLCLIRPDGMFTFDEAKSTDTVAGEEVSIPWKFETNTQGANRAHDAYCHLQQANMVLGNFSGTMRFGIRGHDINGQPIDMSKVVRDVSAGADDGLPWDLEDYLSIQRQMKEWFLYASSVVEEGEVLPSSGQLTLVQYRYTPISVNVGFEFGSVETFEYQREGVNFAGRTTDNGVPQPMLPTQRP